MLITPALALISSFLSLSLKEIFRILLNILISVLSKSLFFESFSHLLYVIVFVLFYIGILRYHELLWSAQCDIKCLSRGHGKKKFTSSNMEVVQIDLFISGRIVPIFAVQKEDLKIGTLGRTCIYCVIGIANCN